MKRQPLPKLAGGMHFASINDYSTKLARKSNLANTYFGSARLYAGTGLCPKQLKTLTK